MANKIILKKTSTASKVPLSTDLEVGEIAVNLADQKLYSKNAGGTVILVGQGVGGSGDVVGGSSSIDNALARYDGTTGKLIQNSTAILDDSGNLDTASIKTDYADLDTGASAPTYAQGRTFWDSGNGTTSTYLNPDVTLQNGQEIVTLVYNGTGSTITGGSVVAVVGAQGQRPSVALADADSEPTSASTLGIATQDIANGAEGFITSFGFIRGVNTSGFTAGSPIYLSQTAGGFTATRPSAPAHTVILGWVIKVNASSGEIFVHINNGWELDELHNVLITSPTSGNTLIYDAVAGVWKNANISAGTGVSVTNGAGSISIANTGVTSAVAGTGISVSGATGAVTISNTGVTSVGATSPIASSGGATPTISISQASSTTNGYLSSTDWNTFNNKGSGTVTSVSATSPISSTGGATPTISHATSGVTAGSYTYSSITVDDKGHITSASSGTAPSAFPSGTKMLFVQTTAPTGWTKDTTNNDKALRVVSGTASTGGTGAFSTIFTSTRTPSGTVSVSGTNSNTTATGTVSVSVGVGTLGVNVSGLSAGATTLAESQIPAHYHEMAYGSENLGLGWGYGSTSSSWRQSFNPNTYPRPRVSPTGGGGSHSHSISGSATVTGSPSGSGSFTGNAHKHTFSGSGTFTGTAMNFDVQYVDVIIATKD